MNPYSVNHPPEQEVHVSSWWTVHVKNSAKKPYYQTGGIWEDFEQACAFVKNLWPERIQKYAKIVRHQERACVVPIPESLQ